MDIDFAALTHHMGDARMVVDVGGGGDGLRSLHPRVTHILDVFPPDDDCAAVARSRGVTFVIGDAGNAETWNGLPNFDYAICSHTLEDTFDPIAMLREIAAHAPRGYIEFPSIAQEVLPLNSLYGSAHHSWFATMVPTAWALSRQWTFSTRPRSALQDDAWAGRMVCFLPKILAYADAIRGHRFRVSHARRFIRRKFWRRPYIIENAVKRRTAIFWSGRLDGAIINCSDFADFKRTLQGLVDETAAHPHAFYIESQQSKQ